jgi:(1->4)-alpha-D-glucan 1-alpha-D-glucosylmutase
VNTELGGEEALTRFHQALQGHNLGNVVDVVPNHVSVADPATNRRWWNVLRDGPTSPDARFFDIDWSPPEPKLNGKVLLAVLANDYADELADGAITLVAVGTAADRSYEIAYGDLRLPVAPSTVVDEHSADGAGLHKVLEQQHYRLACWRIARDELNYRRFFDVTNLAGVRVEDPDVFAAVHARTLGWVRSGDVQGLRIDHPDGLRDPAGYLTDLRAAAPDAWIVIEKILEPGEELPAAWPVDGTTGYDVMRRITGVFVDADAEAPLTSTFQAFVDDGASYAELVVAAKRQVLGELLGTEVTRLTDLAAQCCEASVTARDFSRREIRAAIEALLIAMPVYRTYVTATPGDGSAVVSAEDARIIAELVVAAGALEPTIDAAVFRFLGDLLAGNASDEVGLDFIARFQQLSGPAMAKGVEDTSFYRYNRLIALNEVGADPAAFGVTIDEFHAESIRTATQHPLTMSSTSTHDTKRSEDVRARIALLSEVPEWWHETVTGWRAANDTKWGEATPDRTMEYLLYQTLFGAHPLSRERTHEYLTKAMREAKQVTTWLHPTPAEGQILAFADALAADTEFQAELDSIVAMFDQPARLAALSQLTLKAMGPGIPDFYQGTELWTTSLVDPDNRGDVDYVTRRRLLGGLVDPNRAGAPVAGLADDALGASKMWLTKRLLEIRAAVPDAFVGPAATYTPLPVSGDRAEEALAFSRGERVVVVAAVRPVRVAREGWGSTSIALPSGRWRDALRDTGAATLDGSVDIGGLAGTLGVVVLIESRTHGTEGTT